ILLRFIFPLFSTLFHKEFQSDILCRVDHEKQVLLPVIDVSVAYDYILRRQLGACRAGHRLGHRVVRRRWYFHSQNSENEQRRRILDAANTSRRVCRLRGQ
ncbi:MAG: hypothetical protein KKH02_11355, partial [Proteobacteria bacterium]|nr:hypothetical protein [Pseudomonadota bacterium]